MRELARAFELRLGVRELARAFLGVTARRDLLDVEEFHNLLDAHIKLALYLHYYNEERPHSSLRYRPPAKAMSE